MAKARPLTPDYPRQQARLQEIHEKQQLWVKDALEPVPQLRRAASSDPGRTEEISTFEQAGKGKSAMDAMRARLDAFAQAAESLLGQRASEMAALEQLMQYTPRFGGSWRWPWRWRC